MKRIIDALLCLGNEGMHHNESQKEAFMKKEGAATK